VSPVSVLGVVGVVVVGSSTVFSDVGTQTFHKLPFLHDTPDFLNNL